MQVYAIRMFNFFRFGEENNSVVFDIVEEYANKLNSEIDHMSVDQVYDKIKENPLEYIACVKKEGLTSLIGISGIIGGDSERSNGAGKSTILEAIVYALYNKIVRKNVNSDKKSDAGLSVVLNFNGSYPKTLTDSYVEMFFEENEQIYRVKRGRSFSKTQGSNESYLEFECLSDEVSDDKSRSSHRTKTTSKNIEDIVDRDYDTFCSSLMFGQNDSGKFLTGTDKTRKDMLISMLHFSDSVEKYLSAVRERKKTYSREVSELETKIGVLEDRIGDVSVDSLEIDIKDAKSINAEIETTIVKIEKEITELSSSDEASRMTKVKELGKEKKNQLLSITEQIESQTSQWKKLVSDKESEIAINAEEIKGLTKKVDTALEEKSKKEKFVNSFKDEEYAENISKVERAKELKPNYLTGLEKARQKHSEIMKDIAGYEAQILPIRNELLALRTQLATNKDEGDNFVCDKCKSKVSKQHILDEVSVNSEKESILDEKIKDNKVKFLESKKEVEELEQKILKLDAWINKEATIISEKRLVEEAKVRLKAIDDEYIERKNAVSSAENQRKKLQDSKSEYLKNIANIESKSQEKISDIKNELRELAEEFKRIEGGINTVASKISELELRKKQLKLDSDRNMSNIGGLENKIKTIMEDNKKISEYREELDIKKKMLKRILILEEVCGLEGIQTKIVQKYLPLLNVYIKEVMDILSQGAIEEEIVVNGQGHIDINLRGATASSYMMISGGEKMIVRVATDIGLAMLSFSHCAQKPEIICLDEIFGPLDEAHTETVFDLLDQLKSKFSRVLVIAHKKSINDAIKNKIIVGKESGENGLSFIKDIVKSSV